MAFSYTGLAYLLGFFALGLLTYRFFQYWKKEKTVVSKLFFLFTGFFTLFMLLTAIAGLFFAKNTQILRLAVISAALIQTFALAFLGYLIVYLKFPKISPWIGFTVVFLFGLASTVLTIITPVNPHLELSGGIDWDVQPAPDIIRFSIFLITFIPLIILNIQQIRTSEEPYFKAKVSGLTLAFIFGLLVGLFDFLLEKILKLGAFSSDIAMGILSIILFIVVFFTQKPSSPKEEYIPSSSPRIPW